MSAARTLGRLRTVLRLPVADQRLIAEASAALLAARLLGAVPFRVLARRLGGIVPTQASLPATTCRNEAEADVIRAVRWAVRLAARAMPFRALCLQQALAARSMLARRGVASVLHLGVDATDRTLTAHAWLDAGGMKVTGYPVDPALVEVGRFVALARRRG